MSFSFAPFNSSFSSFFLLAIFLFVIFVNADDLVNFTYMDSYDTGKLTLTLKVSEFFYENDQLNVSFWTRAYNPKRRSGNILALGPLLFIKKGDVLTINLENSLGVETGTSSILNSFHLVNHTNLHTHGLHVNSNKPQDDIFLDIGPGESYQYVYNIPPSHTGNHSIDDIIHDHNIFVFLFALFLVFFVLHFVFTTNSSNDLIFRWNFLVSCS